MARLYLLIAALLGGSGVILGAFGAHGLRGKVTEHLLEAYKTGVQYQMIHALALFGVALLLQHWNEKTALYVSGGLFTIGVVFFSGSLYWLTLGGPRWLGPITPLGGLMMIGGWVALFVAALSFSK
ncbi:DUF423 domain-containing protein [Microbulbifer thermotolerans]|uniref:DUF423 domain-containing protein n=1 Tax=Microbulbifer thermotolerans TaxID=252514 RepID=A0A143HR23_MICTH|nr:DUF423 domain-containing protein [Microbulbifer thermotolerans]AMX03850.1 hypothetical protein A3224_15765 [Microbulbifer thermotolerans]MCX2778649.1 DUF423 domain-containing protein [Microbulbifer thermotolerans]MCX2783801.1 DUF423 domain-containing protein [Microbulbifer thermotolerans]MCX2794119.1 DUF423 domain-containing protein [Microbulbifer thermotolerans]MCX2801610.1 DUF423 domain-containing protein [Microbulbifer thermotolerans]